MHLTDGTSSKFHFTPFRRHIHISIAQKDNRFLLGRAVYKDNTRSFVILAAAPSIILVAAVLQPMLSGILYSRYRNAQLWAVILSSFA